MKLYEKLYSVKPRDRKRNVIRIEGEFLVLRADEGDEDGDCDCWTVLDDDEGV